MTDAASVPEQPQERITLDQCEITLLGTAHVSRTSAQAVETMLASGEFDAVAIELCAGRERALQDPDALAKMDLFQVLRTGQTPAIMANLALSAYQQRIAEQFGIEPGADMRAALSGAREHSLAVELIDRDIGITLKRVYRSVPWWQRFQVIGALIGSLITREKVSEEEIEKLKEGDMLENAFAQFTEQAGQVVEPLIYERDRFMAARLRQAAASGRHQRILAVIGAGHLAGMHKILSAEATESPAQTVQTLNTVPASSRWPKFIPWIIVALIFVGFGLGFSRNPDIGWAMVIDWVWINGGLAAIGAILAAAHPLTVIGAFVAAPLTSLNPTIGAGMVSGALELWLRKPQVSDFSRLRHDTAKLRGWWSNRVTRVFLVFLFSSIGSAIGTYVAGFRIVGRLN